MYCGKPAPDLELPPYLCGDCRYKDRPSLWFLSAGDYEGILKKLIHKMKYERRSYIAELLGDFLIGFLQQQQFDSQYFDCIIPVPLSRVKYRDRGFNQTELIALRLARWADLPVECSVLKRKHHVHAQVELDRSERLNNLRDIFYINKKTDLTGKSVILIDDVRSTGSTIYFCAQTLFEAGAEKILGLTLAFNDR
jgi:ComF family protein